MCVLWSKLIQWLPNCELRQKGSDSINKVSKVRESKVLTKVDQIVHIHCRKSFIDPKRILSDQKKEKVQQLASHRALRSDTSQFKFNEHCCSVGTWQSMKTINVVMTFFLSEQVTFKSIFQRFVLREMMTGGK